MDSNVVESKDTVRTFQTSDPEALLPCTSLRAEDTLSTVDAAASSSVMQEAGVYDDDIFKPIQRYGRDGLSSYF